MDVKFTPHFQTKIPAHLFSKSVNINPACLNTDKFVHYPSTFGPKLIKSVSFVITTTITLKTVRKIQVSLDTKMFVDDA